MRTLFDFKALPPPPPVSVIDWSPPKPMPTPGCKAKRCEGSPRACCGSCTEHAGCDYSKPHAPYMAVYTVNCRVCVEPLSGSRPEVAERRVAEHVALHAVACLFGEPERCDFCDKWPFGWPHVGEQHWQTCTDESGYPAPVCCTHQEWLAHPKAFKAFPMGWRWDGAAPASVPAGTESVLVEGGEE